MERIRPWRDKRHLQDLWSYMHLSPRNFIKVGRQSVRDVASRISSEESVTQRMGLETIVEDTSNFWSTTSESSMASQSSQNVGVALKYNMKMDYHTRRTLLKQKYM